MMLLPSAVVFILGIMGAESRAQREGIPGSGSSNFNAPAQTGNCICTPFYKCHDEESSSNLNNIVNDRSSIPMITAKQVNEPDGKCKDIIEVCCYNLVPQPQTTPKTPFIPIPQSAQVQPVNSPPILEDGACGVRNPNGIDFSVNGFKEGQAQYGEFPWTVALLTSNTGPTVAQGAKNLFVGGGSLIHSRVVLTAAHKAYDLEDNKSFLARLGEWNFAGTTEPTQHQDIPVSRFIIHPRFNRDDRTFNYALLILEREAQLGETVNKVCLPGINDKFDGEDCFVSGWGKDVFGDEGRYSRIMKSVKVNMVEQEKCKTALQTTIFGNSKLHLSFICAGDRGQDACTGDGGSPLVCPSPKSPGQYVQVGITSWGIGCGQKGIPGVYARVYTEWIQEELNKVDNGDYDV